MQISSDARIEILKDSEERPLVVLESRQKTAIAFGVVMAIGIVACVAYLVSRRASDSASTANPQSPAVHVRRARRVPRPVNTPPSETAPARLPAQVSAQTTAIPAPSAPVAPPPAQIQSAPVQNTPPPVSSTGVIQPTKGQIFIQVGNLPPDTVRPFVESLNAKGFRAKLAPGADSNSVRILVGPLKNTEISEISADLTKAGFANFPKFY
ncbi:MAG: hypothetical protein J0H49_30275 [Acidobacteria bacterium]|nr:hypothetical protein [Acidobacteriota bacterium]